MHDFSVAKNIFTLPFFRSFNQFKKHQASQFTEDPHEPIAVLPSTYSVHDFHSFGMQGSGVTPSLHFHLAGSINAETGKIALDKFYYIKKIMTIQILLCHILLKNKYTKCLEPF